jgi:hypothetical protein
MIDVVYHPHSKSQRFVVIYLETDNLRVADIVVISVISFENSRPDSSTGTNPQKSIFLNAFFLLVSKMSDPSSEEPLSEC